ncbi:MAG TPA: hypothetical protein VI461_17470 [Chitinophagaceae bacterium]|nr:hypothetical protein [Chitinophagaceae bacterium]
MIEPLHPGFASTKAIPHVTSLKSLINQLLRHSLNDVMRQSNSSVMNEIPADLYTIADGRKFAPIIQKLLATVINNARKGRIRIRAEKFGDVITLEIQDQSSYNGYALEFSVRQIESMARMAGGYIHIKGNHQLEATVSFSFPDTEVSNSYDC